MLADQLHRPRQRVGPRPRDTGVDEGVEHLALGLLEPRHHRNGDVGEQDSLRGIRAADVDTPGDLAAVLVLRLVGDPHALRPGFLAEPGDAARRAGFTLLALGIGQPADDGDLLAVDHDRGVAVEPVGQPAGEPLGGVAGVWLLGLLPAAGAARPSAMCVMLPHDYMITSLHR